jgi:hypothetical protein
MIGACTKMRPSARHIITGLPELVEGLFFWPAKGEGTGFDRLSQVGLRKERAA